MKINFKMLRKTLNLIFVICLICCSLSSSESLCEQKSGKKEKHIYSTWEFLETDKCAAAWLLKRFIDPLAEFKFFPIGTKITIGTPFDVPDAKIRRDHIRSAFEVLLDLHKVDDPELQNLAKLIHDIEINQWGKKMYPESKIIDRDIKHLISRQIDFSENLEKAFIYFDNWYKKKRELDSDSLK